MNDYGAMVRQLMLLSLAADKPQPYLKPKPGSKGKGYGTGNQERMRAAAEAIKRKIGEQPVVPILPDDPNAQ